MSVFVHIAKGDSYEVPQGVRNAAKRGLEIRRKQPKSKKAGLDAKQAKQQGIGSGVQRASDLMSGRVSKKTIKRMHAFFSRHAKNISLDAGKKPEDDKGYVSGLLWGGMAGKAFAAKMVARFKREEGMKKAKKVPKKYLSGLSESKKKERKAEIRRRAKTGSTGGYKPLPGDKGAKTKPSKYTRTTLAKKVREEVKGKGDNEFLRAVAKITGISKTILRQVHKRGAAAWASGHRPGAPQAAWARARVYSFATGGKTRRTADKDLWAKHTKMKKSFTSFSDLVKATPPTNKPPKNGGVNPDTGTADKPPKGYTGFGSKRGGFRKPKGGGGYDYWYPGTGHSGAHHKDDSKKVKKLDRALAGMKEIMGRFNRGEFKDDPEKQKAMQDLINKFNQNKMRVEGMLTTGPIVAPPNPLYDDPQLQSPSEEIQGKRKLPKDASNTHIILSSLGLTRDDPGVVTDRGLLIGAISMLGTFVFGRKGRKWMKRPDGRWIVRGQPNISFSDKEVLDEIFRGKQPQEVAEVLKTGKKKEDIPPESTGPIVPRGSYDPFNPSGKTVEDIRREEVLRRQQQRVEKEDILPESTGPTAPRYKKPSVVRDGPI